MKIFIVGFMGSGKTTIGKKLAKFLKFGFVDLDKFIENKYQKSISDFFDSEGEEAFREKERECLYELFKYNNTIISTGGGTACNNSLIDTMNTQGITVYIQMNPAAIFNRLANAKGERPLIKNLNNDELLKYIANTLAEREQYYLKSQVIINGINLNEETIVKEINNFLNR